MSWTIGFIKSEIDPYNVSDISEILKKKNSQPSIPRLSADRQVLFQYVMVCQLKTLMCWAFKGYWITFNCNRQSYRSSQKKHVDLSVFIYIYALHPCLRQIDCKLYMHVTGPSGDSNTWLIYPSTYTLMTRFYEKCFIVRKNSEHLVIRCSSSPYALCIYMNQEDTVCVLASL